MQDHPLVLPGNIEFWRSPRELGLHFPALRDAGGNARIALFGAACLVPAVLAARAAAPASGSDAAGWMALWLLAIFIVPLAVLGAAFLAAALARLARSLTVRVDPTAIRSTWRVCGIPLGTRRVACDNVAELAIVPAPHLPGFGSGEPACHLVVKTLSGRDLTALAAWRSGRLVDYRHRSVIIADNVRGPELVTRLRKEILDAAQLEHLY